MDLNELFKDKDQIKGLITLLQQVVDSQETEGEQTDQEVETQPEDNQNNSKIKTRESRRVVKNNGFVNKFESMSEFNSYKADSAIDKALSQHPPVARTREFEPINVVCRVCGKKESINPSLAHEGPSRYKCNNCSKSPG